MLAVSIFGAIPPHSSTLVARGAGTCAFRSRLVLMLCFSAFLHMCGKWGNSLFDFDCILLVLLSG